MKNPRILLVYKDTAYHALFRRYSMVLNKKNNCYEVIRRLKEANARHCLTLEEVRTQIKRRGIPYRQADRRAKIHYENFDLVITVGGDGTFLDAARHVTWQTMFGVNSDPQRSVGKFCAANKASFPKNFDGYLAGRAKIIPVNRLGLGMEKSGIRAHALNDILVCHSHPAVMSHYILHFGGGTEEQRSSGIWISTAAGSTGAIYSAGGKVLPLTSSWFQYRPRELYHSSRCHGHARGHGKGHVQYLPVAWPLRPRATGKWLSAARSLDGVGEPYHLRGGCFSSNQTLRISSLMNRGICCVDGVNAVYPFPFCEEIRITRSPYPLHVVSFR